MLPQYAEHDSTVSVFFIQSIYYCPIHSYFFLITLYRNLFWEYFHCTIHKGFSADDTSFYMSIFSVQDNSSTLYHFRNTNFFSPAFLPDKEEKWISEIAVCACVYISNSEPDDRFSQDLKEKPCH